MRLTGIKKLSLFLLSLLPSVALADSYRAAAPSVTTIHTFTSGSVQTTGSFKGVDSITLTDIGYWWINVTTNVGTRTSSSTDDVLTRLIIGTDTIAYSYWDDQNVAANLVRPLNWTYLHRMTDTADVKVVVRIKSTGTDTVEAISTSITAFDLLHSANEYEDYWYSHGDSVTSGGGSDKQLWEINFTPATDEDFILYATADLNSATSTADNINAQLHLLNDESNVDEFDRFHSRFNPISSTSEWANYSLALPWSLEGDSTYKLDYYFTLALFKSGASFGSGTVFRKNWFSQFGIDSADAGWSGPSAGGPKLTVNTTPPYGGNGYWPRVPQLQLTSFGGILKQTGSNITAWTETEIPSATIWDSTLIHIDKYPSGTTDTLRFGSHAFITDDELGADTGFESEFWDNGGHNNNRTGDMWLMHLGVEANLPDTQMIYRTPSDTASIRATFINEAAATTKYYGADSLCVGMPSASNGMNILIFDSTVFAGDSLSLDSGVPTSPKQQDLVVEAFLFLKLDTIYGSAGDSILIDLYTIDDSFGVALKDATWNKRNSTHDWTTAGGRGDLFDADVLKLKYTHTSGLVEWSINNVIKDTIDVTPTSIDINTHDKHIAIPIDTGAVREMVTAYAAVGDTGHGLMLVTDQTNSVAGCYALFHSPKSTNAADRPFFRYRYIERGDYDAPLTPSSNQIIIGNAWADTADIEDARMANTGAETNLSDETSMLMGTYNGSEFAISYEFENLGNYITSYDSIDSAYLQLWVHNVRRRNSYSPKMYPRAFNQKRDRQNDTAAASATFPSWTHYDSTGAGRLAWSTGGAYSLTNDRYVWAASPWVTFDTTQDSSVSSTDDLVYISGSPGTPPGDWRYTIDFDQLSLSPNQNGSWTVRIAVDNNAIDTALSSGGRFQVVTQLPSYNRTGGGSAADWYYRTYSTEGATAVAEIPKLVVWITSSAAAGTSGRRRRILTGMN